MISNLIRKALGPTLDSRFSGESIRLNAILNEMETALEDIKAIHASDIADNINTYDIASDISIDVDDIQIDYQELGRYVADVINPVLSVEEADLEVIAHKVVKHLTTNTDYRLWKIERKLDLLLNHHGIGAEDLLVYSNSNEENG